MEKKEFILVTYPSSFKEIEYNDYIMENGRTNELLTGHCCP